MRLASGVIVTGKPQEVLASLQELRTNELFTIIDSESKDFLVEHATGAIAKAYVASDVQDYIILIAPRFSVVAQNRLLKIIEEPPRNKHFILITESKSSILPTIKSRLPITVLHDAERSEDFELDVANLNLAKVYEFIQNNNRITAVECKRLVEKISTAAMKSGKYNLDESTLKVFSDAIQALEVGSPTSFILNTVLLKLLAKKKR
ncbi:MAG: DNA polymerase III subunit delta' [Epsilonproteobacteria bacterium]|nr:DNA polymerase III subunit delta' [Campylobacterota bacterium]